MDAFPEICHVCGHVMSSDAPVCPGCFAKSDPAARAAIALLRLKELEAEQATRERESDEQDKFTWYLVIGVGVGVLLLAAIISAKS
jgi:hypothetical protein